MSIRYRNKDGKVADQPSMIHHSGGTRDDVILDVDGVREVLAQFFQQKYGHGTPPNVDITQIDGGGDMSVEIEFVESDPIPF